MKQKHLFALLFIGSLLGNVTLARAQPSSPLEAPTDVASARQTAKAQQISDRKLAKQVRRTLARLKGVDSQQVVVFAKQGAVTLMGSVPDPAQITLVVDAARGTNGCVSVDNALRVKAIGQ